MWQYWSMPRGTGIESGRSAVPGSGPSVVGTVAAYAAAIVAFAYALVSLYWAVGGRGLIGTVGGYVEQMARRGGAAVALLAVAAMLDDACGWRLAEIRKRRGMTQEQVAVRMGVSVARVSQIERGDVSTQDVLNRYVSALGGTLKLIADFGDEQLKIA